MEGNGIKPERWAMTSLLCGATEEPYAQGLVVGPLPVSEDTVYYPYTYATIETADDLADTFDISGIDPLWHQPDENGNDQVIYWAGFWCYPDSMQMESSTINFDGETLLPQGLYIQANITGRDKSKWGLIDTGMRLYDVKFKGERIIYELGLQEAIAHYAGNDPVQSGTAYLDTLIDVVSPSSRPTKFETHQNYPIQRHSNMNYVSTTKNIALTLRNISTVGNYDYNFDYNFCLDGTIETVVRTSDYIQSAFYANNTEYGYQIHDSHIVEPKEIKYKWNNLTRSTMHLVRKEITNEDEGKMNWSHNGQKQVVIANKDAPNKYGEPKGYKIMPSRGGSGFVTHQYYVLKRKDSELRASNAWNDYDTEHPMQIFDGEDIEQEDIVMYFNLNCLFYRPKWHDDPPHNYLLFDPSRQATRQIRIDYNNNSTTDMYAWDSQIAAGKLDFSQITWDPYTYEGDASVCKFPHDPQNPFNNTHKRIDNLRLTQCSNINAVTIRTKKYLIECCIAMSVHCCDSSGQEDSPLAIKVILYAPSRTIVAGGS
ncbi:hypothetical protein I309_02887 [Cryptococcus deuterogattii LA55]|nr:hypothetical protein I309_02887 [Cryptococcus deuterogattii LA55]KIR91718.1 hypothetical protein I304_04542 [Cryptococcus deuterogattii CBS 10090]